MKVLEIKSKLSTKYTITLQWFWTCGVLESTTVLIKVLQSDFIILQLHRFFVFLYVGISKNNHNNNININECNNQQSLTHNSQGESFLCLLFTADVDGIISRMFNS